MEDLSSHLNSEHLNLDIEPINYLVGQAIIGGTDDGNSKKKNDFD